MSTGLIFHDSEERKHLLERRYGTVILDEAHRARRRGGLGKREKAPNNLLDFMLKVGLRTRHLLLGTATPIQTEARELWDLLRVLNTDAEFVLGREIFGRWADFERALPLVKGEANPRDEREVWELIRNPLPPASEHPLFATLRLQLGVSGDRFFTERGFGSLGFCRAAKAGRGACSRLLSRTEPRRTAHGVASPPHAGGSGTSGADRCQRAS